MGKPLIWQSFIQQTFIYWASPLNKAYKILYIFFKNLFSMNLRSPLEVYFQRFIAVNIQLHQRSPSLPSSQDRWVSASSCPPRWCWHSTDLNILLGGKQRRNFFTYLTRLLWLASPPWFFRDWKLSLLSESKCKQVKLKASARLSFCSAGSGRKHCSLGGCGLRALPAAQRSASAPTLTSSERPPGKRRKAPSALLM